MTVFAVMLLAFVLHQNFWALLALKTSRNDWADVAWGLGFVVLAASAWTTTSPKTVTQNFVFALVFCWGLRLAYYLHSRVNRTGEDSRYQEMRKGWPQHRQKLNSYLRVFVLQSVLLLLVATPIYAAFWPVPEPDLNSEIPLSINLGLFVLALGALAFETVADLQLDRFRKFKREFLEKDQSLPAGMRSVMQSGLWKYSRHPNYFGEILFWFAVSGFSVAHGVFWAALGPALLAFLMIQVSGVALTEKRYSKNPDFVEYKKRTSALIPWRPHKNL